ncbi:hypothetical protein BBP40_002760 [Aspergillus hancockii]|nr:hypothetical protein BBP40_002760 [Aspergillus hancockii]
MKSFYSGSHRIWYIIGSYDTGTPGNDYTLGQIEREDGANDVYMFRYRDVPDICGVTDFNQLCSVRRARCSTGTVDVIAHFNLWKVMGLELGNPVFQMVTVEGFQDNRKLDFELR